MADRSTLEKLIADGWALVPITPGEKGPRVAGWQTTVFTPDEFTPDHNVGAKLGKISGDRVDVDLDALQAITAARFLLLKTGLIHGRASKPSSHHWFVCPGAEHRTYKDLDGSMLCELRAGSPKSIQQTVIPPSTHASGEAVVWETERTPLVTTKEFLTHSVDLVAIAALLGRHWPAGSRHQAAGDVAGFLRRLGLEVMEIEAILKTVCKIANDPEVDDRVRYGRETCAKLETAGLKVTGGKALAESMPEGAKIAGRILAWLGKEGEDAVDELNRQYFVVGVGSDIVIGYEGRPADGLILMGFDAFRKKLSNRKTAKGNDLADLWIESPRRRDYETIEFAPPPRTLRDSRNFNLWSGFAVTPDPQPRPEDRCPRFLDHVRACVCSGQTIWSEYLLDLMADAVQRPGVPAEVAVAMKGDRGTGKGLLMRYFGLLFGRHYLALQKQEHLTGRFNGHLSGKVLVFADEAFWAGSKNELGALKALITEDSRVIERKGIDAGNEANLIHLYMATNEDWIVPAGFHERRFFVLEVSDAQRQNHTYFQGLVDEMRSGGPEALLAFLQARVITSNLRNVPKTAALRSQVDLSLPPEAGWWLERLSSGYFSGGAGWPKWKATDAMHADFVDWCEATRARGGGLSPDAMGKRLRRFMPGGVTISRKRVLLAHGRGGPLDPNDHAQRAPRRGYDMPSLSECRRAFDRFTGTTRDWSHVDPDPLQAGDPRRDHLSDQRGSGLSDSDDEG